MSSRGEPIGVDVEVEPFGPTRSAGDELGAFAGEAFVEFDLPRNHVPTPWVGPRNTARIPTGGDSLDISNLNPKFKKVGRWPWSN